MFALSDVRPISEFLAEALPQSEQEEEECACDELKDKIAELEGMLMR